MDIAAIKKEFRAFGIRKSLFLAFIFLFPPLMYIFQSFVFSGMLPQNFVIQCCILDYTNPNVMSMFLANYTHNPFDSGHINLNILSFFVIGLLIWFFYYHIIPASFNLLPKNFLGINLALIFLTFPFAISGIVLFFQRTGSFPPEIRYGIGFSGIVWALTGLLLFLMIFVLFMEFFSGRIITGNAGMEGIRRIVCFIIFFTAFVTTTLFFLILTDVGTSRNPFAHFAGFALGFIIPAQVVLFIDSKEMKTKAFFILIAGTIIISASCMWAIV